MANVKKPVTKKKPTTTKKATITKKPIPKKSVESILDLEVPLLFVIAVQTVMLFVAYLIIMRVGN